MRRIIMCALLGLACFSAFAARNTSSDLQLEYELAMRDYQKEYGKVDPNLKPVYYDMNDVPKIKPVHELYSVDQYVFYAENSNEYHATAECAKSKTVHKTKTSNENLSKMTPCTICDAPKHQPKQSKPSNNVSQPTKAEDVKYVYLIDKKDTTYHKASSCDGAKCSAKIKLSNATKSKLKPCQTCYGFTEHEWETVMYYNDIADDEE